MDVPDFWSSLSLRVSVTALASLEATSWACSTAEGFCSDMVKGKVRRKRKDEK